MARRNRRIISKVYMFSSGLLNIRTVPKSAPFLEAANQARFGEAYIPNMGKSQSVLTPKAFFVLRPQPLVSTWTVGSLRAIARSESSFHRH